MRIDHTGLVDASGRWGRRDATRCSPARWKSSRTPRPAAGFSPASPSISTCTTRHAAERTAGGCDRGSHASAKIASRCSNRCCGGRSLSLTPHSLDRASIGAPRGARPELVGHRRRDALLRAERQRGRGDPGRRHRRGRCVVGRGRRDRPALRPRAAALERAGAARRGGPASRVARAGRSADRGDVGVRRAARHVARGRIDSPPARAAAVAATPVGRASRRRRGATTTNSPSSSPASRFILARALADDPGAHDEARVLLSDVAENGFAKLPFGTFWASALVVTAETACILKQPDSQRDDPRSAAAVHRSGRVQRPVGRRADRVRRRSRGRRLP